MTSPANSPSGTPEKLAALQFNLLAKTINDRAIFVTDSQGKIIHWNDGAAAMLGWDAEEITGKNISLFYSGFTVPDASAQQLAHQKGQDNNVAILRKDGVSFAASVRFTAFDSEEKPDCFAVILNVLPEKIQPEKEKNNSSSETDLIPYSHNLLNASLIQDPQVFYNMFLHAPTAIAYLKGREYRFEMANPFCIEFSGKENMVGRTLLEVYPEIEGQGFLEILEEIYKTGKPYEAKEMPVKLEFKGKIKLRYLNFIYQPSANPAGEIEGVFYFGIDVTEQVEARNKLNTVNEQMIRLFDRVNEGFYTKDIINNTYIHLSAGCPKIYGYTVAEFFHNPMLWYEVIHPEDKKIIEYENEMLSQGKPIHSQYRIIHKDRSLRWIEIKAFPIIKESVFSEVEGVVYDVTERKLAEMKLEEAGRQLQTLFNSVDEMLVSVDMTNYKNIVVSPACEKIYGYTPDEFYADNQLLTKCIHPEDIAVVEAKGKKYLANEVSSFQFRILHKNGSTKWVEDIITPTLDETGKLVRIDGVVRDITQRKESEKLINDSEEKRRLIMNAALDAIICINMKGYITFWNPQAEKIFGWTEQEAIDQKLSNLIIPAPYNEMHDAGMLNYIKTGHGPALNILLELHAIRRNKEQFPIELTVLPIKQGEEEFFCAFIRDISIRKKSQEEILKSNQRFQRVSKATHDAILDWDLLTNDIWVNDNFYSLMGYDPSLPVPPVDALALILHEADRERVISRLKNIHNHTAVSWRDEFTYRLPDGMEKTVLERAYVLKNTSGKPVRVISALMDITQRKKNDEQLKKSREELRQLATHLQTVREEERADISREVHDELGQLLTALKMDIQIIKRRLPKDDIVIRDRITESEKLSEEIIFSVRRIASKLRPPMLDQLGISATLQWYSADFEHRTRITCTFTENSSAEIKNKSINIGLFRIFQEALTNITRHSDATEVAINFNCNEHYVILSIKDNGKGFNQQEVHTKNRLGLLGMKERVEIMNGKLIIQSTPGQGTLLIVKIFSAGTNLFESTP